jgi:hypothetical protein
MKYIVEYRKGNTATDVLGVKSIIGASDYSIETYVRERAGRLFPLATEAWVWRSIDIPNGKRDPFVMHVCYTLP